LGTQHYSFKINKLHPFKLLYGEEAMTPEEIQFQGPKTNIKMIDENQQMTNKDLREEKRMKAIQNLEKY
jgi:hypothetical protein